MPSAHNIGLVILAAGASTRLGKPKQLLKYKGKNLLQNAIDAATGSTVASVVVVLGANAADVSKNIDKSKTRVLVNTEWEEGMAASVSMSMFPFSNGTVATSWLCSLIIFLAPASPFNCINSGKSDL